ncbi:MAG: TOBE domain-containing protein [Actinobacteria bacterium]|nr:TOBE domain-containing protein [Actinomycetota bacterium]
MKIGAQNQLKGKITSIKRGNVMAQIKVTIPAEAVMGSVLTVDSLNELGVKEGDEILLVVKAVNVLPVKLD